LDNESVEVRVITKSRDLDDYDILSIQSLSAAVPHETTESFRHFIWAAMATYAFGNKSIDNVMKNYDYIWQRYKKGVFENNPRILLLRSMTKEIKQAADALEAIEIEDNLSQICAKAALVRLEATFKSAYGLIRKEYIFESDAVIRIILEQIAWAYVAYGTDPDKLSMLKPNKCITKLKKVFPYAGKLYGMLSEWAHIDASIISDYERFHAEGVPVVRRSDHNSQQSGVNLMCLSVVYVKMIQDLFSIYEPEKSYKEIDRMNHMYEEYFRLGNQEL